VPAREESRIGYKNLRSKERIAVRIDGAQRNKSVVQRPFKLSSSRPSARALLSIDGLTFALANASISHWNRPTNRRSQWGTGSQLCAVPPILAYAARWRLRRLGGSRRPIGWTRRVPVVVMLLVMRPLMFMMLFIMVRLFAMVAFVITAFFTSRDHLMVVLVLFIHIVRIF
jgi:hypothetical protein